MKLKKLGLVGLLALGIISCKNDESKLGTSNVSESFAFQTTENVSFNFSASAKLSGASFELYTSDPLRGGKLFGKGVLDQSGNYSATFSLPTYQNSVFVKSTYIGLPADFTLEFENRSVSHFFSNDPKKSTRKSSLAFLGSSEVNAGMVYSYLGTYTSNGTPNYLEIPDVLDQSLLADVNSSLPEGKKVPINSPNLLSTSNDTELDITALADVWVTFVHEGAGYRNVLGYYTYPTNNPPATAADIDTTKIIFPNASFQGSGGGLYSGDKVYLGRFDANTSIGWVLLQNAWSDNSGVNYNALKLYSQPNFNPEPNAADRQHNVTMYHAQRGLTLVGFEDIARNLSNCDQDFNDCVFYVTSNPVTAIDVTNIPPVVTNGNNDDDNDGVDNGSDDYPNDGNKATNQYYPNSTDFASLAFEDLWPGKGDYDFNDLVLDVNYKFVTNATNQVVEMEMKFKVRHIGASHHNGFGIQFPFADGIVSSVSGTNLTENIVTIGSNGMETGQSLATMILFDDAHDNMTDTLTVTVVLNTPYSFSLLNQLGLNPFIFVNGDRGREVHKKDHAPTALANLSYFGQASDHSNPAEGSYYRSSNNYPWAIEINNSYMIPTEKTHITEAYLKFNDWVNSNGEQYTDWYSTDNAGYRVYSKLQ